MDGCIHGDQSRFNLNFGIRPTLVRSTPVTQNSTLTKSSATYTGTDMSVSINLNISDLSAEGLRAADVNGDGEVDTVDMTLMQRRILGVIDKFPVED